MSTQSQISDFKFQKGKPTTMQTPLPNTEWRTITVCVGDQPQEMTALAIVGGPVIERENLEAVGTWQPLAIAVGGQLRTVTVLVKGASVEPNASPQPSAPLKGTRRSGSQRKASR